MGPRSLWLPCVIMTLLLVAAATPAPAEKLVLWVDSYHDGYEWAHGIWRGIRKGLAGSGVRLKVIHMDTKRNNTEAFGRQAALGALAVIEKIKPDAVIASDDNAQTYLVVPYLKGTSLPVVFCGVNWDAAMYGYPAKNVTGIVEIDLVDQAMALMAPFAKGDRVGFLGGDVVTVRKVVKILNQRFFDGKLKAFLSQDYQGFKNIFLQAQDAVDMLFIGDCSGIKGWNAEDFRRFELKHAKIPIMARDVYMANVALFTLGKLPEEQGEWAAKTVLQILDGRPVDQIPMARNKKAELIVNMDIAEAMGVVVPISVLKTAKILRSK